MANRFWVGGSGNWSDTAHWSATTGGAGFQSVPTSADMVTIDSSSGTAAAIINLDVTGNCLSLNINSTTNFTGSMQWNTNVINVYGATQAVSINSNVPVTMLGTPVINAMNATSTELQMYMGNQTEPNSISVNIVGANTGARVFNLGTHTVRDMNFLNYAGTLTQGPTVYGNCTLNTAGTYSSSTTFGFVGAATSTLTTAGKSLGVFTVNKTGSGSVTLLSGTTVIGGTILAGGNLNLNSQTFTTNSFLSSYTSARSITFGTSFITCNGTGTVWNTGATTNFSYTGTPLVQISNNTATATTVSPGPLTEAQAISFAFTTGTYPLTFLSTATYSCKNADFTGFAGTWNATSTGVIYGNLTLATGMALTASTFAMSFRGTSGTQVITSNTKTIDFPLTLNGVGGTFQLADALLMGTTRALTHTNGTLDLNGKTLTVGTAYTTATGTKNLTFNGGTLVCPTSATTAFNNAVPTGYTTAAGTGTGKISMTAATAKTFVGGGSTFNCTLSNDGAGALTVSGSNTFTAITNGVQPTAFTFTAGTTQTVTNWTVSGTAGNLVTITSGTAGTAATLSKASGTVSSDYLSRKDSTATGGAAWYAGANSTNVSGNLGWIFTAPPATNTGNFFFMF